MHIAFMAVELDPVDLQILTLLRNDGRASTTQIADQVGLSRPAVADRIEKLERNGVIRGHTVVVDPIALGQDITAFVAARKAVELDGKAWKAFQQLMKADEVLEAHTVAGDDCFFIKVRTDSIASLTALVSKLTAAPICMQTRTTIVMRTHCEKVGGIVLGEESES
jgi:Lrp/AsnC family leucine-responsive transcriptional regulator